jgi:hypothetical protein
MEFNNLKTYCITGENLNYLKNLNLKVIVGGACNKKEKFPTNWLRDNLNNNISAKNKNFGSLTSIYWIWKNELKKYKENTWIGISHYRRFWLKDKHDQIISLQNLNKNLLDNILNHNLDFDAFVASSLNLTGYKPMKLLKKTPKNILRDPSILINKNKHNIKLHFDMFHLYQGLEKATEVMNDEFKNDFLNYIHTQTELFSPFSIFILKKNKFNELCEATFEWIHNCENIFDTNELHGHGQIRLFDYLAERFFSFWIKKNTNYKVCPFVFFDPKLSDSSIIQ